MTELIKGEQYKFKHTPQRLTYMGYNWSGNGYWHQFDRVEDPGVVWSELLDSDLCLIEPFDGH